MSQGVRSGTSEAGRSPRPLDRDAAIRPSAPLSRAQFRPLGQINLGSHIEAQQTPFSSHTGPPSAYKAGQLPKKSSTRIASRLHGRYAGLVTDLYYRARMPARIAREATLAAAILFGTLKAVAPNNQHHLCFLKRLSTVMPSVIQQEIVGARVEPRSTRNQFETSAGAQAPSDKLQTPAKGTA